MEYSHIEIPQLKEILLKAIKEQDADAAEQFIISIFEKYNRSEKDIMHSIELLTQEMAAQRRETAIRFDAVDKRFEAVDKHFNSIQWFLGFGFSLIAILMALFKFLK